MKSTASETVYRALKHSILTCVYRPGQLLTEKELTESFETSRTPVREAVNALRGEGLLLILDQKKGVQVTEISPKKMLEIYELRCLLESLSVKQAVRYVTDGDISRLRDMEREEHTRSDRGGAAEIFSRGMEFHLELARLSRNATLEGVLRGLRDENLRGLVFYLEEYMKEKGSADREEILRKLSGGHERILDALATRDCEATQASVMEDMDTMSDIIRHYCL